MKPLLDRAQGVAPLQGVLRRCESLLLRHAERYARLQSRSIPPGNECRNHGLVSARRNAEKVDNWHLVLESLTKPSIVGVFGIVPLESIVDCLIAFENLSMNVTLVIIPNLVSFFREDSPDRQQKPHLLRFEDPTLGIVKRDALASERKALSELARTQVVMRLGQLTHMVKGGGAHLNIQ